MKLLKYTQPGSNWRPSACEADVIATRPWVLCLDCMDSEWFTPKSERAYGWYLVGSVGLGKFDKQANFDAIADVC